MRDKTTLVLGMIEDHERSILDIGCGDGNLAQELSSLGKSVFGVERESQRALKAKPFCRSVIVGDVEEEETFRSIRSLGFLFDAILLSEILEHLAWPDQLLLKLSSLLKPSGAIVAVVPNIAFYKNRWMLLRGDWRYASEGHLDQTHLRFFTGRSTQELFQKSGFSIVRIEATHYSRRYAFLYDRLVRWWPGLFGEQFVVRAFSSRPI